MLGLVWCGVAPNKSNMDFLTDLYDLPKNLKPYCIVGLGYPVQDNANKFVDRYDEAVVRYVKYEKKCTLQVKFIDTLWKLRLNF